MKRTFCLLSTLAIIALTGCGGGKQTTTTTTQSQPAAPAAPMAAPGVAGKTAAAPSDLHCGASAPVWANTKTHVYHVSSDPLYGKTKRGVYMCAQYAVAHGYHAAGGGSSMKGAYRRRHKGAYAQPAASPAASP